MANRYQLNYYYYHYVQTREEEDRNKDDHPKDGDNIGLPDPLNRNQGEAYREWSLDKRKRSRRKLYKQKKMT